MLHYLTLTLAFLQTLLPAGMCLCQCQEVLVAVALGPQPAENPDHDDHDCDCGHQARLAIPSRPSGVDLPMTGWMVALDLSWRSQVFPLPALGLHSPGPPEQRPHLALHVLLI